MQYHKNSRYTNVVILIKTAIFLAALILISLKLFNLGISTSDLEIVVETLSIQRWWLILVVLLMPVNWGLEAVKWRIIASKLQPLSFLDAFRGVICGLSMGFVTPRALGDYFGRIFMLDHQQRESLVGPMFLGRLLQMMATLFFGIYGVTTYLKQTNEMDKSYLNFIILSTILFGGAIVVLLNISNLKFRHYLLKKILNWFQLIPRYKSHEVFKLAILSMVRYLVFSFQFMIILQIFIHELTIKQLFAGVSWIFLVKSIIPSLNFLADLSLRQLSAMHYFELYGINELPVIASILSLWMINLFVPSVIGTFLFWKLKFWQE